VDSWRFWVLRFGLMVQRGDRAFARRSSRVNSSNFSNRRSWSVTPADQNRHAGRSTLRRYQANLAPVARLGLFVWLAQQRDAAEACWTHYRKYGRCCEARAQGRGQRLRNRVNGQPRPRPTQIQWMYRIGIAIWTGRNLRPLCCSASWAVCSFTFLPLDFTRRSLSVGFFVSILKRLRCGTETWRRRVARHWCPYVIRSQSVWVIWVSCFCVRFLRRALADRHTRPQRCAHNIMDGVSRIWTILADDVGAGVKRGIGQLFLQWRFVLTTAAHPMS